MQPTAHSVPQCQETLLEQPDDTNQRNMAAMKKIIRDIPLEIYGLESLEVSDTTKSRFVLFSQSRRMCEETSKV